MNGNPSKARRIGGRVTSAPILLPFLALMMLAISPSRVGAQNGYFFPEGERFDPQIPSPEEFLGYPIGTFTTRQDRIVAYLKELARLSDRATYQSIGTSFEHREMPVLTVTSPENHGRLEAIRQEHLASLEPGGATAGDLPAIAHFGYNVHGNEASGGEAALLTAYWLVAGMGAEIDRYLDEGIFHIEPTLNPDGRDRYASWTSVNRAQPFVPDPVDREHNEVWPGGRTNHYWFDLNRDWFPLVNPESRARIEFHHHWRPNLVTDHHEMGTSSTFFFEPTKPVGTWNPLLPERLYTDLTVTFADYWTEVMDDIGSMFFSEEVYDNSYPGYG
ncbi:MAG: zinc carboxypeptidase, partial [Gemmatimonadetes bacterium]|nr:zinc carboxypeptidase [Gemmatimonadota bacterium]